jgi:hypothetical protein
VNSPEPNNTIVNSPDSESESGGAGDDKMLYKYMNRQNMTEPALKFSNDTSSFGGDTLNGMCDVT